MAYLFAQTSGGSVGTAANWATCYCPQDPAAPTATSLTTSFAGATGYTPGGITIDGIGVKFAQNAQTNAVTVQAQLIDQSNANAVVFGPITVSSQTDIPACTPAQDQCGWFFFQASQVALTAGHVYAVQLMASATSNSTQAWANGATTDWAFFLRQPGVTASPGSADSVIIGAEWTASGTSLARSVTMDTVSTTAILQNNGGSPALGIYKGGTVSYGTGSLNYYLKVGPGTVAANVVVHSGGTLNIGTSGAGAMPPTSSAVLEFNITAGQIDGLSGLTVRNLGTFNAYGATVTTTQTTLTADAAPAATTLTVGSTSGWVATDTIVIASTSRTWSETENRALSTVASGTSVTVPALTYLHGGGTANANVIAEVMHLPRNVKIRSTQTTLASTGSAYIDVKATAVVACQYVEFSYLGANVTAQRGIEIETSTGSCSLTSCSIHDCRNGGLYINGTASISAVNMYNCNTANPGGIWAFTNNSGASTVDKLWAMGCAGITACYIPSPTAVTLTNVVAAGNNGHGMVIAGGGLVGTFYGHAIHSNGGYGIQMSNSGLRGVLGAPSFPTKIWRNNNWGWSSNNGHDTLLFDTWTMFGNNGNNIGLGGGTTYSAEFRSCTFNSDASFSTTTNLNFGVPCNGYLENCTFSNLVAATNDISPVASGNYEVVMWGGSLAGTNPVTGVASVTAPVRLHNVTVSGAANQYRSYSSQGNIFRESTTVHSAGGYAWKMLPNAFSSATRPLRFPGPTQRGTGQVLSFAVPAGLTTSAVISCWVCVTAFTSGTAPTLRVYGGPVAGAGTWNTDAATVTASTTSTKAITGATNASPISVTATAHGYSTGNVVGISGIAGNTAANGTWTIAVVDANTFTLNGSTGNGAYTSGGGAGLWQQLTATLSGGTLPTEAGVLECQVTCDGPTTNICFVDDFAVTAT